MGKAAKKPQPSATVITANSADVHSLFTAALHWASTDDTRPHLSCLHIECNGKSAKLCSTDGHGLWVCPSFPVEASGPATLDIDVADVKAILKLITRKRAPKPPRSAWKRLRASAPVAAEHVVFSLGSERTVRVGRFQFELAARPGGLDFPASHQKLIDAWKAGSPEAPVGVNPRYLLRTAKALPGSLSLSQYGRVMEISIQTGRTVLDAIKFSGFVGQTPAFVLLMPMRVGP